MYLPNQPSSRCLWKCRLLCWGPNLTFTSVPLPTRTVYMLPYNFRRRTVFACSLFLIHEVIYLHCQVQYCQSASPKDRGYVAHAGEWAVRRVLAGSTVCRRISFNVRWPYCTALNWKQHVHPQMSAFWSHAEHMWCSSSHRSRLFDLLSMCCGYMEAGVFWALFLTPYKTHSFVLACHGLKLTWYARWNVSYIRWILFLKPCGKESIKKC